MDQLLTQIGAGGILTVLVLRLVFDFLKDQREKKTGATRYVPRCIARDEMVPMATTLDKINRNMDKQSSLLGTILERCSHDPVTQDMMERAAKKILRGNNVQGD